MGAFIQGSITKSEKEKDKYKSLGVIAEIDESTFEITELPIRMWTQSYKESLELWVSGSEKVPALVKVRCFSFVCVEINMLTWMSSR